MSAPHDHSQHGHDHDHDHGPGGHSHGPGDGHTHGPGGHDHGPGKPPTTPPPGDVPTEDAGSQALSEALKSSFAIVKVIMWIMVVVFIASGLFTVAPQNVAVVLRFGKAPGDGKVLQPGPHWAFPRPIEEVVQIPVGQIQTVMSTSGWYATTPEQELSGTEPGPADSLNPATEGYTLTADGNIMHVRAKVRYRISDPAIYAFNFVQASNFVENAVNNAILNASSQFLVDNALRHDRTGFKERVEKRVRQRVETLNLGISVDLVEVVAIAPRQVKDAFNAVYEAELDMSKAINAAQGYTNQILAKARGEADAIINGGKAEAIRLLQSLESDATSFSDQLKLYQSNPMLFRERRLTEVLARVATNGQDKYFLPERGDGKPRELRLMLNPEPLAPKVKELAPPTP